MANGPCEDGPQTLKNEKYDPDSVRMRHFFGALLPSEQMVAGIVISGLAFFFGFGSLGFWTMLGLGTGWFLNGLGKFVRAGGLRGELARERGLHPDI